MGNFAYLIGDTETNVCAVVDPGFDPNLILEAAKDRELKIEAILLTHTHFDHMQSFAEVARATGAKTYVHRLEADQIPNSFKKIETDEGFEIQIGSKKITCLHTPGHSLGSQCFLADDCLFTGDSLFVGACGRVDLPGGNPRNMLLSLKRLASLDPKIKIFPGHDYGASPTSTIEHERKTNPFMNANSESALI